MGRKYGRLQYGRYTYDLGGGDPWIPIEPGTTPPLEIWVPTPPSGDGWGSSVSALPEIWIPVAPR